ncbi:MAG: outer membrane protein assembly factor BamA [Gammaproteobacteria bacterium]|nr:outer membrane protein assembly factor BamA [Gammaproteobacteria bacterium]
MSIRKLFVFVCLVVLGAGQLTHAAEQGFVVSDIRVEGLNRISAGTVFNYFPVKVGDSFAMSKSQDAIRAVYKTGFFTDVSLHRKGTVLIVRVKERPSIASIKLEGAKEISESDLRKGLKDAGLAEGRIFSRTLLDRIQNELKRQYFSQGRYSVEIDTIIEDLERNRVAVNITVKEGLVATIRQINLIGNKEYSDDDILDEFMLSSTGMFSFMSSSDQYSRERLIGDTEILMNMYRNNGYMNFNIESTQVSISPDKENIYITISMSEGDKYFFGDYKLSGNLIGADKEIAEAVAVDSGSVFSRDSITKTTQAITGILGKEGYAFANVNAIPDVDEKTKKVNLTFYIDPGKRTYVRRINFFGNAVTRDDVLRREMRQLEGGWFSPALVNRSRVRLQRLGFFDAVNIETPQVPGTDDQVDINVMVKERPTGNLLLGIGYSDVDGALVNGSISEKNLLGSGKELSASFDNSKSSKHVNLKYVNPYYTDNGIERGFTLYAREIDAEAADTAPYILSTNGLGVFFTFPTTELQSLNAGVAYESNKITVDPVTGSRVAIDFVDRYGEDTNALKVTMGWSLDSLNKALFPSSGGRIRLSIEGTTPGSDVEYYRTTTDASYYIPLTHYFTFRSKLDVGYGRGFGDSISMPFYKNYYVGGSSTLRGYESRSLGPVDSNRGQPIGGNKRLLGNLELFMPVPGSDVDDSAMRLSLFVDSGMVYPYGSEIDVEQMRHTYGIAFHWFSPIGPLSFSYAWPFNEEPGDQLEKTQFSVGVPFR